jgi:hypothetical protein
MSSQPIQPGDRVHDRDDPDPDDAIVVNQPPTTASEWDVQSRDCTLADDNPDYPEDASVVVVCFVDDLVEYGPPFDPTEQTALSLSTLNESGVNFYTFPAPRLTMIESPATDIDGAATTTESDDSEPTTATTPTETATDTEPDHATEQTGEASEDESEADTGPAPALQQLTATLEDNGLAVTIEDADTLMVEQLGQTYRIHADGGIEGDGALRSQLETIVQDAT